MSRIVHLSDLHFGRDRPDLLRPLLAYVNGLKPDLVLVSGDLTQRARHSQFRAARTFFDHLEADVLAVPGNHDTPLDNLWVRLLRPWSRFRQHIAAELQPCEAGPDYTVAGINTADPWAWQRGKLRSSGLRRACRFLSAQTSDENVGIVMMHHPPEHEKDEKKRLMRGSQAGLARLSDCGADVVLCGHLHSWRVAPFTAQRSVLLVQAGTGLSTRHRGAPNDFNLLDIAHSEVNIERHATDPDAIEFSRLSTGRFRKRDGLWETLDDTV
ncbi:metallophosphoesterase family protein [Thalassococcus sp. BH17M4-6]|uniref:metallophosphoesterase family protein n=1 Tax=Thalassococcus sp. BH17M4-6 TaxID=3413148 RepID=UPI003BE8BC5D